MRVAGCGYVREDGATDISPLRVAVEHVWRTGPAMPSPTEDRRHVKVFRLRTSADGGNNITVCSSPVGEEEKINGGYLFEGETPIPSLRMCL